MSTRQIVQIIKTCMKGFDENQMYAQMRKHYQILQLMDPNGGWASAELQQMAGRLLPTDITEEKSGQFIDAMSQAAEQNPYLMRFLERAQEATFEHLAEQVRLEGKQVIPDLVALSFVFDKLTKAMYDNPAVIRECVRIFENKKTHIRLTLFHRLKLAMVGGPVKQIFLKSHRLGRVSKRAGSWMLPLNIGVATVGDYLMGYKDNVKAGWTLTRNKPGAKAGRLHAGAASAFSEDRKAIRLAMPNPKEWADLYQTWNMAFVSQIGDFVYLLPKLCIPQVAEYQDKPTEYIYNRVLALYVYLHYSKFAKVRKTQNNEPYIQWSDRRLTELWGQVNAECAAMYEAELKAST